MKLLKATVSKAPRQVSTKYGERLVCNLKLSDGSESTVWAPVGCAPVECLKWGQTVTVSRNSKGKVFIEENHPLCLDKPPASALPQGETQTALKVKPTMTTAQKKEIAGFVEDMASLYAFCYSQAIAKLPPETENETCQACASSLFIASQRRFELD